LVKYGLGCTAKLAPAAIDYVSDVTVDITIGASRLRITRSIDSRKGRTARVTDLITRERLPDHHADDGEPSLNTLLMTALGLPADMRAAARSAASSNAGNRITFADVFTFPYIPQSEINTTSPTCPDYDTYPGRAAADVRLPQSPYRGATARRPPSLRSADVSQAWYVDLRFGLRE
jgi:hypothetical protein